jgi:myo-inositol-1(or 4)-monophosphatase
MSAHLHPMLNVAVKAARAAGNLINRASLDLGAIRVGSKQANDFVTEVDHAAEATIIDILLGAYPDHGIWAEESGRREGKGRGKAYTWIIDPLDGTTNFIHGFPVYCVSIALMHNGRLEQAVIFDPTRNDLFTASKGRGAYLNDRRLRVARRTQLRECLLSTGFPFRPGDAFQTYLKILGDVMPRVAGVRRPGSAALDLAYVAAGYSDGFFELGLSPWDVAAGALLVTEAGGLIGNFSGEADFLEQKECLAANPRIYGQLVALLSPYSRFGAPRHGGSEAAPPASQPAAASDSDAP